MRFPGSRTGPQGSSAGGEVGPRQKRFWETSRTSKSPEGSSVHIRAPPRGGPGREAGAVSPGALRPSRAAVPGPPDPGRPACAGHTQAPPPRGGRVLAELGTRWPAAPALESPPGLGVAWRGRRAPRGRGIRLPAQASATRERELRWSPFQVLPWGTFRGPTRFPNSPDLQRPPYFPARPDPRVLPCPGPAQMSPKAIHQGAPQSRPAPPGARGPSPVEGRVDPLFAGEAQHPADHVAVVGAPAFVAHLRPAVRKPDFHQPLRHGQGSSAPPNGGSNSHLLHLQVMLYLGAGPQAGKESQWHLSCVLPPLRNPAWCACCKPSGGMGPRRR